MQRPLVDEAYVLPEEVGRMAAERAGGERGALEICGIEVEHDQLQELFREVLKLACVLAPMFDVGGVGATGHGSARERETH